MINNYFFVWLSKVSLEFIYLLCFMTLLVGFSSELSASRLQTALEPGTHSDNNVLKRYHYQVSLSGFTSDEVNIISGIALSSTDNVYATLENEETKLLFLNYLLPITEVTYKVSTVIPPSQFRVQMTRLFERMNVEAYSTFSPQENTFLIIRAFIPYTSQIIALWGILFVCIYAVLLLVFWAWMHYQLKVYQSLNQASKWVKCVLSVGSLPIPLLLRKKWLRQLPYWEKRIVQADIWFGNAQQLVQNNEIQSADIFVKKALEENASNTEAKALETFILQQLSMHKDIQDEREQWKQLVSKSIELSQQGKTLAALEKAYNALALCEGYAKDGRSGIDPHIDSVNKLIQRISLNTALKCDGLILQSDEQKIYINAKSTLHIGRALVSEDQDKKQQASTAKQTHSRMNGVQSNQNIHVLLPQETLSRIGNSIAIEKLDNGFAVEDLGSTNGLWLQYKRCEKGSKYMLCESDILHLSPPNDAGAIGFEVRHIGLHKSIALTLCQNSILPSGNVSNAGSFLNAAEYNHYRWYLTQDDFYLVLSFDKFTWYSASEWQVISSQDDLNEHLVEVLKIQFVDRVWLHLSGSQHAVTLDGYAIAGPVPLPEKSQLCINNTNIQIELLLCNGVSEGGALLNPLAGKPAEQPDISVGLKK